MLKKRQIVLTRVLEFGGNNTYLKTIIKYFGKQNILVVLFSQEDLLHFRKIDPTNEIEVVVLPNFREMLSFKKGISFYTFRETLSVLKSLFKVFRLSVKHGFADIFVSVIDPEMYLYLVWLPFIRVTYVLHSDPCALKEQFTTTTCNVRLGIRKKIITVSHANKKSIITTWKVAHRKEKHVHVVYNCLAQDRNSETIGGGNDQLKVVLTMGHVLEYKNPQLWLDVARRVVSSHKNTCFYWLGNGQLLESFQLQTINTNNIKFIGLITDPDLYLKKATIYYQPSLIETQGIAVIEAMSYQLPCVVSDRGGLPESVENNENGYVVNATNVDENVSQILSLLENEALRNSFGAKSYNRYRNLFTYEKFKKRMDNIYWQLII